MKKRKQIMYTSILLISLAACSSSPVSTNTLSLENTNSQKATMIENPFVTGIISQNDSDDGDDSEENTAATLIKLEGNTASVQGNGVEVAGNIITITSAGFYKLSGTLNDGQIIIDSDDAKIVKLVLEGVDINNSTGSAIYIKNAEKTVLSLAEGSNNLITDGNHYVLEEETDEPDAALFSHDDLTINGSGTLIVTARYKNGIVSKDDLKINGGNIQVNAVNDGLKGNDLISITDGTLTLSTGGDGMQSSNADDPEKGYISIEGGTLNITATLDGIQAETSLLVSAGDINITTGGGSANSSIKHTERMPGQRFDNQNSAIASEEDSGESMKGMKAGTLLAISGGRINIDSADDALHSDAYLTVDDGEIALASGDDGIHANISLTVNGGSLDISQSYEGIESAAIILNDGTTHLISSDDGINAASGSDGSQADMGQMRGPAGLEAGDNTLIINGGYLYVDAGGDGLDINGSASMSGGVVLVNGPTNNGNGPLDYYNAFDISGGLLIAAGSSGMAQAPTDTSAQSAIMVYFDSIQPEGTLFHIESEDGAPIVTFMPSKAYQSLVFSSPNLQTDRVYHIYSGGSSNGTASDGLYSSGTYTAGTLFSTLTTNERITIIGNSASQNGFPDRGFPRNDGPPGSHDQPAP